MGKLADKHDLLLLQEVRGNASDVALLADEMRGHVIYSSHCALGRAGGVMTIIRKSFLKQFGDVMVHSMVDGRVLRCVLHAPPSPSMSSTSTWSR